MKIRLPDNYLYVTKHQFKNNISKILRLIKDERCRGAVITHYRRPVAMVLSLERPPPAPPGDER